MSDLPNQPSQGEQLPIENLLPESDQIKQGMETIMPEDSLDQTITQQPIISEDKSHQEMVVKASGTNSQQYLDYPNPTLQREQSRGATEPKKNCNCKNSRCLKLYCECFSSGEYCRNCNCVGCQNNQESEEVRRMAVENILERNPHAFRPKISCKDDKKNIEQVNTAKHAKGCACKKSGCLKKYCECFQANIFCSDKCKCCDCKNFSNSVDLREAMENGDVSQFQQPTRRQFIDMASPRKERPEKGLNFTKMNYNNIYTESQLREICGKQRQQDTTSQFNEFGGVPINFFNSLGLTKRPGQQSDSVPKSYQPINYCKYLTLANKLEEAIKTEWLEANLDACVKIMTDKSAETETKLLKQFLEMASEVERNASQY